MNIHLNNMYNLPILAFLVLKYLIARIITFKKKLN